MKAGDKVRLVGDGGQSVPATVVLVSPNGVSIACWIDHGALPVGGGVYLGGPVPLLREGAGYVDLGGRPVGVIPISS